MDTSSETPAIALDVRDLRMRYGDKDVLTGVTFSARRGEVLALLGPNGAGKTTTIEILEGFRMRSAGTVSVLGIDPVRGNEAWRARIGVVLQSWRDHKFWRVRELLAYLARFYAPFATAEVARPWNVDELIAVVGLSNSANAKIVTLSGGQRRRLDVAIGIVGRPEIVFFDEPTAGFDPHARRGALMKSSMQAMLVPLACALIMLVSGLFYPIARAPAWMQWTAQAFPVYWVGLGARSAMVPPEMVAVEIGQSWRTVEMFAVLGAWTLIGLLLAPILLRRMARRQSGSALARTRERYLSKGY